MRLMFPSGYEMINSASIAGSQTIVRHVVYQSFVFSLLWHDCLDSRARFLEQIRIIRDWNHVMHDGSQRILHAGEKVILSGALLWRRTHKMEKQLFPSLPTHSCIPRIYAATSIYNWKKERR